LGNSKKAVEPASENYTILHALVEALHEKDKEKNKRSILSRFKRRG
jgi:hypothetical protein